MTATVIPRPRSMVLFRPRVARTIAVAAGLYMLYYLLWRATATLNPAALAFSILVLVAEAQGVIQHFLFAFMTWELDVQAPFTLRPEIRVDVYVPTYNEPLDILEATLTGCMGISYPHTTYVLDDGRRPEVRRLAEQLGCRYLTRPDNRHAKAGNLNAALRQTDGDFIVVLDADMVPQPDLLDRTLGYFVDDQVAIVQLPQEFYNLDSIQHDDATTEIWHDQSLFYRVIQPGKNRWNAAFWCGSPSVVRREALEAVGGVATETVTEDIHTSIRLHRRGWKIVYHDEILAYGIAPQTLEAFATQRLRWAQGSMQLLRSRENPLIVRGLSIPQRLNYLASMSTYFDSFQKLIYLLTPAVILVGGLLPLKVTGFDFLAHWTVYILLGALANVALGRGHFRYVRVEQYNVLKMFTFIRASLSVFWPMTLQFRVTPKRVAQDVTKRERRQLIPLAISVIVIAASIAIGLAHLLWRSAGVQAPHDIVFMTIAWAGMSSGLVVGAMAKVLRRNHHRVSYRFAVQLPGRLRSSRGTEDLVFVRDLSQFGAGVVASRDLPRGDRFTLLLSLPTGTVTLPVEVTRRQLLRNRQLRLGVRFASPAGEDLHRLLTFLYVTLPRQQQTPGASLAGRRPAGPPRLADQPNLAWSPGGAALEWAAAD